MSKRANRNRRRRAYGEGSTFQRKDGRWCSKWRVGTLPNGRPDIRYVYGETETEAAAKLDDLKHLQRTNMLPLPNRTTVDAYADKWLDEASRVRGRRGEGLAPNTVSAYRNALNYLQDAYGEMLLRDLTGRNLSDLYLNMQADGLSVRMREMVHKITGQMLRAAVKERIITHDVTQDVVNVPRADYDDDPRALTQSEVAALLEAAEGTRWAVVFQLAIDAALGRGEVLGVTWGHVDLEAGTLDVEQQVLRRKDGGGISVSRLKTKARRRHAHLSRPTIEALRRWRDEYVATFGSAPRRAFLFPGGHWRNPDPLRPLTPESAHEAFVKYADEAGITDATFHNFRSTAATWMAEAGVPLKTAARRLGHSNIHTVSKYYTRVEERSMNMAADVIGDLFDTDVDTH